MEVVANFSRDLQSCTSMDVNSTSQLALFAGRRVLGLVNLENPTRLHSRESRQSKWDVITCQWSFMEENKAALASNNKVEIFNLYGSDFVQEYSLRAHTRVVTDLAWHTHNKDLLVTSATDAYIYLWDLRDARRPKMALQAVAGAAKVKWNKVSGKYLATAHEGEVKLWDVRQSKSPVQYINAHLSRIYDMDWSNDDENHLVTTGQDLTVKFWNIASPNKAENVIKIQTTPVWRVQHTPFGHGLLTLGIQSVVLGKNNLLLWNNNNLVSHVHTFYVPDLIMDLAWRQWSDSNQCQLVTWSKDHTLRLWNIDLDLQEKCGLVIEDAEVDRSEDIEHVSTEDAAEPSQEMEKLTDSYVELEEEETVILASPLSSSGSSFRQPTIMHPKFSESIPNSFTATSFYDRDKPMNLNYEFSLINYSEDKLRVEFENSEERIFTVSASTSKNQLVLNVKFPLNYPNQVAPTFSFLEGTTIDNVSRNNILQKLKSAAKQQTSRNRRCLESCLRQFELSVEALNQQEEEQIQVNNPQMSTVTKSQSYGEFPDRNIPFPRSSGARFCGDGNLICFGLTRHYMVKVGSPPEIDHDEIDAGPGTELAKTPRSLSALTSKMSLLSTGATSPKYGGMGGVMSLFEQNSSHQDFPFQARVSRVRFSTTKSRNLSTSSDEPISVGTLEKRKKSPSSSSTKTKRNLEAKVTVYDCSALMPYCKKLAARYLVPCSFPAAALTASQICVHNAKAALEVERADLHRTWSLAAVISSGEPGAEDPLRPWATHPCGRALLANLINHHVAANDVQTAAVLVCIFGNKIEVSPRIRKKNSKSESVHVEKDSACDALSFGSLRHNRSNSDTQNEENSYGAASGRRLSTSSDDEEYCKLGEDSRLLEPKLSPFYNRIIESYAELLYRWKMLQTRTEVVKEISELKHMDKYISNLSLFCPACGKVLRGPWCIACRTLSLSCSVCRSPCRGLVVLCQQCGHGGHTRHLAQWFNNNVLCPAGCGCQCPRKSYG